MKFLMRNVSRSQISKSAGGNALNLQSKPDADQGRSLPLERYFRILEILAAHPQGLSLHELAAVLLLPKGTVHRLLSTMQRTDLVATTNNARLRYLLAGRVRRLGLLSIDPDAVASLAQPLLKDFSEKMGETCYLCRLEGTVVKSIAISSPNVTWTGYVLPGKILQPHATAAGKAVMAYQPPEIIDAALDTELPALSEKTKTHRDELLAEYADIRKAGFATCIQEVVPELSAFAAPVNVEGIGVRYSIGILGPHSRIMAMLARDPIPDLKVLANALSQLLVGAKPFSAGETVPESVE